MIRKNAQRFSDEIMRNQQARTRRPADPKPSRLTGPAGTGKTKLRVRNVSVPIPKFAPLFGILRLRTSESTDISNLLIWFGFGSEIRMAKSRQQGCGFLNHPPGFLRPLWFPIR
jgi:hypothetical protein